MIIKRYIASDMNEAVTRIRYELGKDAVIISQRKIRKKGLVGLFSKKSVEVTAAIESAVNNEDSAVKESIEAIKNAINKEKIQEDKREKVLKVVDEPDRINDNLLKEMHEVKAMVNSIIAAKEIEKTQSKQAKTPAKSKLQLALEAEDVNENLCKKIITKIKNIDGDLQEDEKFKQAISKLIPVSNSKMEGRVILVGPTGVGKTTTIAKLAGKLALIEKKKVGLITVDTYRIGAVEQLKTYAEIMGLPIKVVITTKEMELALESMKDFDVVLIDTTGRSCKNTMQISEMRAFIEKANTRNIHLVVSSTTKNKDISAIVEGYRPLNYNNLIITKLDETSTYGSILNIIEMAKKPLSFVTTGQNVPDDIKSISTDEISNLILGVGSI